MNTLLQKLEIEYYQILQLGAKAEPEQQDRRQALSCIITEVKVGTLTKSKQQGNDSDVMLAAETWLDQMDVIYDPLAKSIWSQQDLDSHHRVRKHMVEIINELQPA